MPIFNIHTKNNDNSNYWVNEYVELNKNVTIYLLKFIIKSNTIIDSDNIFKFSLNDIKGEIIEIRNSENNLLFSKELRFLRYSFENFPLMHNSSMCYYKIKKENNFFYLYIVESTIFNGKIIEYELAREVFSINQIKMYVLKLINCNTVKCTKKDFILVKKNYNTDYNIFSLYLNPEIEHQNKLTE